MIEKDLKVGGNKIKNGKKGWDGKTCCFKGCENEGKWAPTLHLFADKRFGNHPPAIMEIDFLLCPSCKSKIKSVRDLHSDEGMKEIDRVFMDNGKAPPDWTRTVIKWRSGIASEFMPRGS